MPMAPGATSQRIKKGRAFAAYVDLLDAADCLREKMSRNLVAWDLTVMQFRVMEIILHEGPQYQEGLSRRFGCTKQNIGRVLRRLVECGCLRREAARLPLASPEGSKNPNGGFRKPAAAVGRRVMKLHLTAEGEKLIAHVYPRHASVVKAEMRVLHGREQATLSRLCRKLKEGDFIKYFKEITMVDEDLGMGRRRRII